MAVGFRSRIDYAETRRFALPALLFLLLSGCEYSDGYDPYYSSYGSYGRPSPYYAHPYPPGYVVAPYAGGNGLAEERYEHELRDFCKTRVNTYYSAHPGYTQKDVDRSLRRCIGSNGKYP